MSNATRRLARFSAIVAIVALAPAGSAVGQSVGGKVRILAGLPHGAHPVAALAGRVAAVAGARESERLRKRAEAEALRRRLEAREDARVAAAIERQASTLRPGSYVWRPERAGEGPVEIVASLAAQRLYVFRAGKLIAISSVSTGRAGHRTPTGRFPILQKRREHFSNLYNNAPMPNMQRMTWDGIALHAGNIPSYPASHGCVRLPLEFSRLLFAVTSIGSSVHVVAGTPGSPREALAFAVAPSGGGSTRLASAR